MNTKARTQIVTTLIIFLAVFFSSISPVSAAFSPTVSAFLFTPKAKEPLAAKREILDKKHQQIEFEALSALTGTQNALMLLNKNDPTRAIALLKEATKQLNMLLAKYPHTNLIPAIIDADIYEFDSDTNQVEKMLNTANELIADHRVQAARQLLDQLVSEIHVTKISVPLGSFSMGVNDAASFASSGNIQKAQDVLHEVLNRLVKTTEITPIPMLQVADLLSQANKLEHIGGSPQDLSKSQILTLLDAAKEKLKFADILGYGAKGDYNGVYDAIDEMKQAIFTEKSADAWAKVSTSLSGLKDKLIRFK